MEETFTVKESGTGKTLHRIVFHTRCSVGTAIIVVYVSEALADVLNTVRILVGTWILVNLL